MQPRPRPAFSPSQDYRPSPRGRLSSPVLVQPHGETPAQPDWHRHAPRARGPDRTTPTDTPDRDQSPRAQVSPPAPHHPRQGRPVPTTPSDMLGPYPN